MRPCQLQQALGVEHTFRCVPMLEIGEDVAAMRGLRYPVRYHLPGAGGIPGFPKAEITKVGCNYIRRLKLVAFRLTECDVGAAQPLVDIVHKPGCMSKFHRC